MRLALKYEQHLSRVIFLPAKKGERQMLGKKMDCLLRLLSTDNTRLAAYAGCSESNFSRLKSGSRLPSRDSTTVRRFAEALYSCAADNAMTGELASFVGAADDQKETVCSAVTDWLFSDDIDPSQFDRLGYDPAAFGDKLNSAMDLAGISNSRLARYSNVDPSYISRMRSGKRMPKNNPELIDKLCEVIVLRAAELGRGEALCKLMDAAPEMLPAEQSRQLAAWLYDRSSSSELLLVKKLISNITVADSWAGTRLPSFDEIADESILNEKADTYQGIDGIRRAVIRFLGGTAFSGGELILYSDQSMAWMQHDYLPVWAALMRECLNRGVRIKIIHNISRSPSEMISAVSSWLPLYMSGMIEPYYCPLSRGELFGVTLYLSVGRALIESISVKGDDKNALYRYITDPAQLAVREGELLDLLSSSRPLLRLERGASKPDGIISEYEQDNICICTTGSTAAVVKRSEPAITFTFNHPNMVSAIQAYIKGMKER